MQEGVTKLVLLPLETLALYRPAEVGLRHHDGQSSQHHLVSTELVSTLELQTTNEGSTWLAKISQSPLLTTNY